MAMSVLCGATHLLGMLKGQCGSDWMEWDDLRYVLAASRAGSFLGAANLLKVSHTTVARRIKALENDLGKSLFLRTRDGCAPTEACFVILPTAERMEQEMRTLQVLALDNAAEPEGRVRINTGAWLIQYLLIPYLPEFFARYPRVQIYFVGDVVESRGEPEAKAFSLRFDVMAQPAEIETELETFTYSVYGPADRSHEDLPWLTTYSGSIPMKTYVWLTESGITPSEICMFANDAEIARTAVGAGVGIGLLPDVIAERDTALKKITTGDPALNRTLRALVPRHISNAPEVQATLRWAKAAVKAANARSPVLFPEDRL